MRKKAIALILIISSLIVLLSCDEQTPPPTVGTVSLHLNSDKSLSAVANTAITSYSYNAIANFNSEFLSGATGGFVKLGSEQVKSIGELTQGSWTLKVRGHNSAGSIVATGETTYIVKAGVENKIPVKLITDKSIGKGNINFEITGPYYREGANTAIITYKEFGGVESLATITLNAAVKDGLTSLYKGSLNNLQAGFYDFHIAFLNNGIFIGGESIRAQVVANEVTKITGHVVATDEITADISISAPGFVQGEMSTSSSEVSGTGKEKQAAIYKDKTYTFTWSNTDKATVSPNKFIWALDGKVEADKRTNSYQFTSSTYGEHRLSVLGILVHADGTEVELGSATIHIAIPRRTAAITYKANSGKFTDGTDVMTITMDTFTEIILPGGGQNYDGLNPHRPGFEFTGWLYGTTKLVTVTKNTDKTYKTVIAPAFQFEKPATLIAEWKAGIYDFNIIWGPNAYVSGTLKNEVETFKNITYGAGMSTYLKTPTRTGFTFEGFYTEPNGRGEKVTASSTFNNITMTNLYVYWKYIPRTVNLWYEQAHYDSAKRGDTTVKPYRAIEVGYGLRYGALPYPNMQGFVFKGWFQTDNKTEVTANTVVTINGAHDLIAHWEKGNIPIKFNIMWETPTTAAAAELAKFNGKTGALGTAYGALPFDDNVANKTEGSIRNGYVFQGWYDSTAYKMRVYSNSIMTTNNEHTLYASWRGNKYIVTFDALPGQTKQVRFEEPYGELPIPPKYGYTFLGWTLNGNFVTEDTIVKIAANHKLIAKFAPIQTEVFFSADGGTVSFNDTLSIYFNEKYELAKSKITGAVKGLPIATKRGYRFEGWRRSPSNKSAPLITNATVNQETFFQTLYAHYIPNTYSLTTWFKGNAASYSVYKVKEITFGSIFGSLDIPEYYGYTFGGWYYNKELSGERATETTKVSQTNNINLYPKYTKLKITLSFNSDGGTEQNPITIDFGSKYPTLPIPIREGYDFVGWQEPYRTSDGYDDYRLVDTTSTVYLNYNYTLKAKWKPMKVKVTLDAKFNGVSNIIETRDVMYNEVYGKLYNGALSQLPIPVKYGYNHKGWYDAEGYLVASDTVVKNSKTHTLINIWVPRAISVIFVANDTGLSDTTKQCVYDTPIGEFPQYSQQGKLITGWYYDKAFTKPALPTDMILDSNPNIVNVMESGKFYLYAKWEPFVVKYYYNTDEDENNYLKRSEFETIIKQKLNAINGYFSMIGTLNGVDMNEVRISEAETQDLVLWQAGQEGGSYTSPRKQQTHLVIAHGIDQVLYPINIGCPAEYPCEKNNCGGDGVWEDWTCPGHPYSREVSASCSEVGCEGFTWDENEQGLLIQKPCPGGHTKTETGEDYCTGCEPVTCDCCNGTGHHDCPYCENGMTFVNVFMSYNPAITFDGSDLSAVSSIKENHTCQECYGTGILPNGAYCEDCSRDGICSFGESGYLYAMTAKCLNCNGTGKLGNGHTCPSCYGGYVYLPLKTSIKDMEVLANTALAEKNNKMTVGISIGKMASVHTACCGNGCSDCGGRGYIINYDSINAPWAQTTVHETYNVDVTCPTCNGNGKILYTPSSCPTCGNIMFKKTDYNNQEISYFDQSSGLSYNKWECRVTRMHLIDGIKTCPNCNGRKYVTETRHCSISHIKDADIKLYDKHEDFNNSKVNAINKTGARNDFNTKTSAENEIYTNHDFTSFILSNGTLERNEVTNYYLNPGFLWRVLEINGVPTLDVNGNIVKTQYTNGTVKIETLTKYIVDNQTKEPPANISVSPITMTVLPDLIWNNYDKFLKKTEINFYSGQ